MAAVILSFDQPFSVITPPIVLNFIYTPPPIVWGNIGVETSLDYGSDAVELVMNLPWYITAVEVITKLAWYSPIVISELQMWWGFKATHDTEVSFRWGSFAALEITESLNWGYKATHDIEIAQYWNIPASQQIDYDIPWLVNPLALQIDTEPYFSTTPSLMINPDIAWRSGADQREMEYILYWGPHKPRWICTTKYIPPKGNIALLFSEPGVVHTGHLTLTFVESPEVCVFDDGGGLIDSGGDLPNFDFNIPIEPQIKRVYLMQPELIVTRVSDGTPIIVTGVTISGGRGMFTNSITIDFSSKGDANLAINQLLLVEINGYDFYAIPEQINRSQSFGRVQYSATGRSRTALLADPWRLPISYSNTVDRSLGGILADILIDSGWSAELVGFSDFNVPARVFTISGKAPIESVNEIADMIGCMVVANEFTSVLSIVPFWPVTPWSMASATPAVIIHDAVILSYNSQDEINQLCNACWVRGEQQGVSRHVKRTGTAGEIPTSDQSASLIVTDIPARLLGTAKIADTGKKERIVVTLSIMDDLPPLVKGMLIGVNYFTDTFKATCDSVSISATVESSGAIDVVQSVVLIRHME